MSDNKAMELADRIHSKTDWYEFDARPWCESAAAELRRQDQELADLSKAYGLATAELNTARAELERIRTLPVVRWEFRWTNPGDNPDATEDEMAWKLVETYGRLQTLEQKVEEIQAHRYNGKPCYEVRALFALTKDPT